MNKLDRIEKNILDITEARNKLESFLYELREFFDNEEARVFYDGEAKI